MTSAETIHVMTTRPNNRATNLVEAINRLCPDNLVIKAHHTPLIEITEYYDQAFFEQVARNATTSQNDSIAFDGVIFISGNAVDWAQRSLAASLWQSILTCPLYAIGEQTASVLQTEIDKLVTNSQRLKTDNQVIYPQQMNSEGLLSLPELQSVTGQQWLIVKGKGGRDRLKTGLQAGGASVTELSVYQRQLPNASAQQQIAKRQALKPIWLISSIQALENLCQILNHQVQDCRIIISSDRIAEQASQMGFSVIAQAADASDKQLLQTLKTYIGN
jgi:uroporphyrinogen-III synthase